MSQNIYPIEGTVPKFFETRQGTNAIYLPRVHILYDTKYALRICGLLKTVDDWSRWIFSNPACVIDSSIILETSANSESARHLFANRAWKICYLSDID